MEKGSSEDLEAELERFAERLKDKTWIERSYEAIETLRTEAERQEDENASLRNAVTTLATKPAPPPPPLPLFSILAGGLIEQKQTAMPRSNYP
ncbi:hypothetical protein, partial [Lutibaculum baratangense]|uniref:hypothetical protein n=1 Tax=Lutibaculum baratangense TaxID=1358440 RepID=UPI00126849EB